MRRVMIALFVLLLAPILFAAGWNKAYFAATKPGTWATIRVTSTITPPFTTTSTRRPDVDGRVVIEQRTESGDSASPPSTMRYELASGFIADRDLIDGVLRRLDERARAIVVLHYFLGMPLTDVAATLGVPVGTVKSRLHRALGEMRVAIAIEPTHSPSPVPGGQLA